jgi:hypothetical protein
MVSHHIRSTSMVVIKYILLIGVLEYTFNLYKIGFISIFSSLNLYKNISKSPLILCETLNIGVIIKGSWSIVDFFFFLKRYL